MAEILAPDWSYAKPVTPSDGTDNVVGALWLHNRGTGGDVPIVFSNGLEATLYLRQGEFLRGGRFRRVKSTGLGAGVSVVALY